MVHHSPRPSFGCRQLRPQLTIAEAGEQLLPVSRNTGLRGASIYQELGASSRNGAVEQATAIGLRGA